MSRAFRMLAAVLVAASFVTTMIWSHESRIVGDDDTLLLVALGVATLAYFYYWNLQQAWQAGTIAPNDGVRALLALVVSVGGLVLALSATTEKVSLASPRTYTNLFTPLIVAGVCIFFDAIFAQERYKRAHGGLLPASTGEPH